MEEFFCPSLSIKGPDPTYLLFLEVQRCANQDFRLLMNLFIVCYLDINETHILGGVGNPNIVQGTLLHLHLHLSLSPWGKGEATCGPPGAVRDALPQHLIIGYSGWAAPMRREQMKAEAGIHQRSNPWQHLGCVCYARAPATPGGKKLVCAIPALSGKTLRGALLGDCLGLGRETCRPAHSSHAHSRCPFQVKCPTLLFPAALDPLVAGSDEAAATLCRVAHAASAVCPLLLLGAVLGLLEGS